MLQASLLAKSLRARSRSEATRAFTAQSRGMMATTGRFGGMADLFGICIGGSPVWLYGAGASGLWLPRRISQAITMKLYDSPFSPFARKVRMVLELKGLAFEAVDGLLKSNHAALREVNGRVEVPALVDGEVVVVNSSDIVAYLEQRAPEPAVCPRDLAARVHARAWERAADSYIDPIFVDISYWTWADREDGMPEGLLAAAREDLARIYTALDAELAARDFVSGELSIADLALWPHLAGAKALGVEFQRHQYPHLARWFMRMRALPVCQADLQRLRDCLAHPQAIDIERRRIFWRGERIEWLLTRGFHDWFFDEIRGDRVAWPAPPLRRLADS